MCASVYMHMYAHLFVRATICRKSLLFQINRANKFYVRSFIFIEWASKETLSKARHTQCGDGNRNWSKTVRSGMESNWIWICACVCVCVLDVFWLISVSQFDIVRMHAKTIDGNVKANYSRIFFRMFDWWLSWFPFSMHMYIVHAFENENHQVPRQQDEKVCIIWILGETHEEQKNHSKTK